jgi:murein L,D-transpeptidase YcbB/YkuD
MLRKQDRVMNPAFRGRRALFALAILLLPLACGRGERSERRWENDEGRVSENWEPDGVTRVLGVPLDTLKSHLRERLERGEPVKNIDAADWRRTRSLYEHFGNQPLWLDGDGLRKARTEALLDALRLAPREALGLEAYPVAQLRATLSSLLESRRLTPDELVDADVLLTATYVALGRDMFIGQIDPHSVAQSWHIDARQSDVDSALVRTLRMEPLERGIARMRPQTAEFDSLRQALARYRELVQHGGWTRVPDGQSLSPRDTADTARLRALAERLRAEQYLDGESRLAVVADSTGRGTGRAVYDAVLAGAVARFQTRHAIEVDSVLGPNTLGSLNVSAEYRLRQIAANMERYRWLPRTLGDRYVFVNVPAFRLEAYDHGQPVLDMKVIVGAEYNDRATPAFSDSMSTVVFRPYWNVPANIALDEILPAAQRDPGYMSRHGYEVVRGWGDEAPVVGQSAPSYDDIESERLRIRQRPVRQNALGSVKFLFPNDFAIYLHDTPTPALFDRDVRAFSHGCIRVERPADLAHFVLGWDAERIRQAMTNGPENRQVPLERKLPVYILYLTTYVRNGELYFGNDLYDRDETLTRAVAHAARPDTQLLRILDGLESRVD